MGLEIERKFLVKDDRWQKLVTKRMTIVQGYLTSEAEGTVVRIRMRDQAGFLTIKAPGDGVSRPEFEYPLPDEDARQLLALCQGTLVRKERSLVPLDPLIWEIDVFSGANAGLVLAECELDRPDSWIELPPWVGNDVTGDIRYTNAFLSSHPYREWAATDQE